VVASEDAVQGRPAYQKPAQTRKYDQSTDGQAIATFEELMTLYRMIRGLRQGEQIIASLRTEQAHREFERPQFTRTKHQWRARDLL